MTERYAYNKYFSLFHDKEQRYSEMKPCHSAIDSLIQGGVLIGQLTLDQDMMVSKIRIGDMREGADIDLR